LPPWLLTLKYQRDPECGAKIRTVTSNKLEKVLDTIATPSSAQICSEAISSNGGLYVNLMGIDAPRPNDVRNVFFLGYSVIGEPFDDEGLHYPAAPEDFESAKGFIALTEKLLEFGLLKAHPVRVGDGLEGVLTGMQELRDKKVSGVKLVYRV
jgi:hypothetical protein